MMNQLDATNLVLTAEGNPSNVSVETTQFDWVGGATGSPVSAGTEGVACFVITEVVVGYQDDTAFGDADKLYMVVTVRYNAMSQQMYIPFNMGGVTGHHVVNPLVLNLPIYEFAIDETATTNVGNIHVKGYRVVITNL